MTNIIHNVETGEITEVSDENDPNANLELAWIRLRLERDALLQSCDWTVLADTPTSTAAWKAYRQQLRDLPANTTDPHNVVWPTPPA
jgi:hypothetical protein